MIGASPPTVSPNVAPIDDVYALDPNQAAKHVSTTSKSESVLGLVFALAAAAITIYFLRFLYQVKHRCPTVNKTARQLAEGLLWTELAMCALCILASVYMLVKFH